jgi:adenylate cyclase class 2
MPKSDQRHASLLIYTAHMATPQEVEIKFLVPDLKALEKKLKELGFKIETPSTHEVNALYDLPSQTLRRKGEILRLRDYGGKWKLTHKAKGKPGKYKSRAEAETVVSDGKQMDAVLRALGFSPVFAYEKFRSEWTDGQGQVVLDHTPIGDVAEIEGKSRWIDRTARTLGIESKNYITKSYAELFVEWKRKTNCEAVNMTFRECGKCTKAAKQSAQPSDAKTSSTRRGLRSRTR